MTSRWENEIHRGTIHYSHNVRLRVINAYETAVTTPRREWCAMQESGGMPSSNVATKYLIAAIAEWFNFYIYINTVPLSLSNLFDDWNARDVDRHSAIISVL